MSHPSFSGSAPSRVSTVTSSAWQQEIMTMLSSPWMPCRGSLYTSSNITEMHPASTTTRQRFIILPRFCQSLFLYLPISTKNKVLIFSRNPSSDFSPVSSMICTVLRATSAQYTPSCSLPSGEASMTPKLRNVLNGATLVTRTALFSHLTSLVLHFRGCRLCLTDCSCQIYFSQKTARFGFSRISPLHAQNSVGMVRFP